jgi:long-chain acyl-CoA synthetase
MRGYWNQPAANASRLHCPTAISSTGDVGVFDEKGFLKIVDRKKDMMHRFGIQRLPQRDRGSRHGLPGRGRMRLRRRSRRKDR